MAQRTAFLNSDAIGYNKDFHHSWIHNYLIAQPGVMFSNYQTKTEFNLGNGQITGGKAIIRCTRTTGAFAGSEILVIFESTSVENISVAGDKKVFIEIPEIYINDSSSITNDLTQGLNLGVGIIKSESAYPSHSNYIPLREITGGDWANATDVRPEILRKGQPDSITYYDATGVERRLALNSTSLNKFIKSNGPGVAPSWDDVSGVVEVQNLKNTFIAGETILPKSMFKMESELLTTDALEGLAFGYDSSNQKRQLDAIIESSDFDEINLNLRGVSTPADEVNVRIETVDGNGHATGTLIHINAYGVVTPTGTLGEVVVSLSGLVSGLVKGTKCAVVLNRTGALSISNYYEVGVKTAETGIWFSRSYNGSIWATDSGKKGYVSSIGLMSEAAIQAKATTDFLSEFTGYCEAGASIGNSFTGIRTGMFDYIGAKNGDIFYLTDTGELSTSKGTIELSVAFGIREGLVDMNIGNNIQDENIIELIAAENIAAEKLVVEAGTGYALKTIVRNSPKLQSGTTTGLDSSTTQRMIRTKYVYPGLSVCVYKKASDNKLYATVTSWGENVFQNINSPLVGQEKLLSDDVLEVDDGFDFCLGGLITFGNQFVVVYKKASDDKVYGVSCTFDTSTRIITAGNPVKLYDTSILQSGTRPTCCNLGLYTIAVGIHNDSTDEPIVIPCTISGTSIIPGSALTIESVTMNSSGQVLVVSLEAGVVGVFYDDGINISFCPAVNDCTSVKTPIDLIAGYISGSMLAMVDKPSDDDFNGSAEVMLFIPSAGNLRVLTVNAQYYGNAPYSYFNTLKDEVIYMDTSVLTGYDICPLNYPNKYNFRKCSVGLLTKIDGSNALRLRSLRRGNNGFQVELDKNVSATTTDARGVCLCNIVSPSYDPRIYMAWIDNSGGNLEHSVYLNNGARYIGVTKNSALAGQKIKIVTSGPAKISNVGGGQIFIANNGNINSKGTHKAGEGIGTDLMIVK